MYLPNRETRSCVVKNISGKTVDVLGFRLKPRRSVDLFTVLPSLKEWQVLEALSPPSGDLYIESEQKGSISIIGTNLRTYDHLPERRISYIGLENFRKGSTAPANVIVGTDPGVGGVRFANTLEKFNFVIHIPGDYHSGAVELEIHCILDGTETVGNEIDFTCHYIVVDESNGGPGGNLLTQQDTTLLVSTPIISGANEAGVYYGIEFEIEPDDQNNPFSAGSHIFAEIHRTTVGGAGKAGSVVMSMSHLGYLSKR
jgi:hypothetical protein